MFQQNVNLNHANLWVFEYYANSKFRLSFRNLFIFILMEAPHLVQLHLTVEREYVTVSGSTNMQSSQKSMS